MLCSMARFPAPRCLLTFCHLDLGTTVACCANKIHNLGANFNTIKDTLYTLSMQCVTYYILKERKPYHCFQVF